MAVSRGGDAGEVLAAGPTDLKRYLPLSLAVTSVVAGLPLWVAFGLGARFGVAAMLASIALSFGLAQLGNYLWQRHRRSRDVVFNDLMLWGFIRRTVSQRGLLRSAGRLGLDADDDPDSLTLEERTDLIKKLAVALETGDPYTHGHSQRVARHAHMVAKSLKLPRHTAEKIRLAGVIHDVGKLRTPREIITKPGALTEAEFETIQRHTIDGAEMVKVLGDDEITDMVRHHHERLDGTGYPDRLRGDDISIGARVLAVADTFDAASSLRPYRGAQKHKVALDILEREAEAARLDPVVVHAFIRYYSGRRALRWWSLVATSPAQLRELPLLFAQRVGTASIANVAVVGVTAMALTAGSPMHGGWRLDHTKADRGKQSASDRGAERSASTTIVSGGSSTQQSSTADAGGGSEKRSNEPRGHRKGGPPKPDKPTKDTGRPTTAGTTGGNGGKPVKDPKDTGKPENAGPPTHEDELIAGPGEELDEEQPAAAAPAVKGPDKGTEGSAAPVTEPVTEAPEVPAAPGVSGGKD